MLRDNPMKSAFEYAHGLDGMFDGLMVEIKENSLRNSKKEKKSDPARLHAINGYLRDEEYNIIDTVDSNNYNPNDLTRRQCAWQFTD